MKIYHQLALVLAVGLIGCGATPVRESTATTTPDTRNAIVAALKAELDRSMDMRFRDYEPPYFIAYGLNDETTTTIAARFGSVFMNDVDRERAAYVEVRVGDYTFDNFANIEGESFRLADYAPARRAPLNTDAEALRGVFWLLTDDVYKKAVSDYLTKRGSSVYDTDEKTDVPSFSKETPQTFRGPFLKGELDRDAWAKTLGEISKVLTEDEEVIDSQVDLTLTHATRYFVNSEGTDVVQESLIYSLQLSAFTRAPDGMLLDTGRSFYAREVKGLPSADTLRAEAIAMVEELKALREAPVLDPYTGPAILAPEASGVLFHEVIGHRLEGERQRNEEEGRTFKGRVGKAVLPEFLSVYDDPTLRNYEDIQLNGFYHYDQEGVAAQKAVLIEDGVLKGYLKSRTPIEGSLKSNGHGRAQGIAKPIARMSNLVIEANAAAKVPYDELKKQLMAEVKAQGKPFGLIIRDITGGSTNTSGWGYQAFKGSPRLLYKVDPDTGEETLVRGVELVGTPLTSINKIIAASDNVDVFNGYCGAESGYVPVSTVAPALLTTEIELQRKQQSNQRPPILPAPWKN
jgi:predicted Zn-dependent protease